MEPPWPNPPPQKGAPVMGPPKPFGTDPAGPGGHPKIRKKNDKWRFWNRRVAGVQTDHWNPLPKKCSGASAGG